jgi:aminomethyltransferase
MTEATAPHVHELTHTPLEAEHVALGAHMGAFGGWLMPIQYEGTIAEHTAVREAVGMFDVSHLGKLVVEGPDALGALQRTLTDDLSKVPSGGAQYGMCLNERGGIVDDLITYRLGEERFLVVPNAANVMRVQAAVLRHALPGTDVVMPSDLAIIAPQGPRSFDLVGSVFPEAPGLAYMACIEASWQDQPVVVSRSGYTGERGFELFVPDSLAAALWRELRRLGEPLGLRPAGLAARDTLRLEMGYPLHGNDISEERTPLEAGGSWAVAMDKGDFDGREALVRQQAGGVPARLWALRMLDRLIPRAHYAVFDGDEQVGETTSGTFSPTLKMGIAMGYLSPRERFAAGDHVEIDIRGRRGRAELIRPPFVRSSPR